MSRLRPLSLWERDRVRAWAPTHGRPPPPPSGPPHPSSPRGRGRRARRGDRLWRRSAVSAFGFPASRDGDGRMAGRRGRRAASARLTSGRARTWPCGRSRPRRWLAARRVGLVAEDSSAGAERRPRRRLRGMTTVGGRAVQRSGRGSAGGLASRARGRPRDAPAPARGDDRARAGDDGRQAELLVRLRRAGGRGRGRHPDRPGRGPRGDLASTTSGGSINRQMIEGQIEGCVAQAIGYALLENFQSREGQVADPVVLAPISCRPRSTCRPRLRPSSSRRLTRTARTGRAASPRWRWSRSRRRSPRRSRPRPAPG